jgi:hypothetical protein
MCGGNSLVYGRYGKKAMQGALKRRKKKRGAQRKSIEWCHIQS